jgi:hypothetical protein
MYVQWGVVHVMIGLLLAQNPENFLDIRIYFNDSALYEQIIAQDNTSAIG